MNAHRANEVSLALEDKLLETLLAADLTIEQVVRPFILECPPDTSLREAARRMNAVQCGSILVVDDGVCVGIWTERDALAIDFDDPSAFSTPVRSVMSSPVKTVAKDATLQEVALRFRDERVRHFLVVGSRAERMGVVSQTDVVLNQGIEHYMRLRTVGSIAKSGMVTAYESEALTVAARRMRDQGVDAMVVEFGDGSRGIVTERDVLRCVADSGSGMTVGEFASRPLITVRGDVSLYRARALLIESHVRHLVVVDAADAIVGLLSFSDILDGIELAYVHELQHTLRERNRALSVSRRSLRLAEKVIQSSLEGVMITDRNARIESVNPAFTRLTGYRLEDVAGKNPSLLSSGRHDKAFYRRMWMRLAERGHWQGEIWNRRKSGEIYPELLTITAITDEQGEVTHYAALFSDISALKENEERIKHLAYFDPLTGIPNRRLFLDRLGMAVAHAKRNQLRLAVMFVDVDRFKRINDSLGHSAGDRLLLEVAQRLRQCVREDDTVARLGGDEFVILLPEIGTIEECVTVARRITASMKEPMSPGSGEVIITCSVGVAVYPEDGIMAEELVRNADAAMYRAKDTGRDAFQLYTPAMNARSLEHLAMEVSLRRSIEREELEIHYQPIVDTRTGRVVRLEALLRWNHPDMGLVMPADFIPLAEESGLIVPMGEWVFRRVCRQIRDWRAGGVVVPVAVNISVRQFRSDDFLHRLQAIAVEEQVPPGSIDLELTETLLMDEGVEVVRMLERIREMGMGIAIDDFGVGYSSLNYLRRFPVTSLKIDRSFIRDLEASRENAAIVSAVIGLAHSLGLYVVAEGVETDAQFGLLRSDGCDMVQGFFFSRPAPVAELVERFEELRPRRQ